MESNAAEPSGNHPLAVISHRGFLSFQVVPKAINLVP
jgi:hypothetical protein